MKKLFSWALGIGVHPDLTEEERKRTILTNGISAITGAVAVAVSIVSMLGEFLSTGYFDVSPIPGSIAFIAGFMVWLCMLFNHYRHYQAARYGLLTVWWITFTVYSMVYGSAVRFDQYLIVIMVLPLAIFHRARDIVTGSGISVILFTTCQVYYRYYDPLIHTPDAYAPVRYGVHTAFMLATLLGIFYYFKKQNEYNENLIRREIKTRIDTEKRLKEARDRAEKLARTDFLTGLDNRRAFFDKADIFLAQAQRQNQFVSVIMMDLDHFKQINDTHGHAAGDAVLIAMAEILRNIVRKSDPVARIGGEEFAVLMPQTPVEEATMLAERLRSAVEKEKVYYNSISIQFTLSLGVVGCEDGSVSIDSLMTAADHALYRAKEAGRNRVVTAGQIATA